MKVKRQIMALLLVCSLTLGLASFGRAADDLEKKIDTTSRKIRILKHKESNVLGKLVRTQKEMDRLSFDLSRINSRVGTTRRKMRVIDSQLDKTKLDIAKISSSIDARKDVLNTRLVSIYKYGYQSYLEVLFQINNFANYS